MPDVAPTSRTERRKTEFRDKITDAALKLFAENGVADTSVASIIKEADIAHKTFFNHFPTKDHLLQHVVSSHTRHAYVFFREILKRHTDPKKQMEYCLMGIAHSLQPLNPERYSELVTFYIVSSASTKEFREEQKQNFTGLVHSILRDAESKKMVREDFDLETLGEMIVGICVSTLLNWCVETDFPIVEKMKNAVNFINQSV
ncbi:MAG TPA: TetR/AcrR family transcriptional regulator, partial [Pseudomonadales bacterium]|nr:TetR/AcrR family transcriptional regulator [Pseudomonadales bacterium]